MRDIEPIDIIRYILILSGTIIIFGVIMALLMIVDMR